MCVVIWTGCVCVGGLCVLLFGLGVCVGGGCVCCYLDRGSSRGQTERWPLAQIMSVNLAASGHEQCDLHDLSSGGQQRVKTHLSWDSHWAGINWFTLFSKYTPLPHRKGKHTHTRVPQTKPTLGRIKGTSKVIRLAWTMSLGLMQNLCNSFNNYSCYSEKSKIQMMEFHETLTT